jgi:hypothetical protein
MPAPAGAKGGGRAEVGRTALRNLLQANLELFPTVLDRCYDKDGAVARGYFQVGCGEVWRSVEMGKKV